MRRCVGRLSRGGERLSRAGDLGDLRRNRGLPCLVVAQRERLDNLQRIVRRILHSDQTSAPLARGRLEQFLVELHLDVTRQQGLEDLLWIRFDDELLRSAVPLERLQWQKLQNGRLLGQGRYVAWVDEIYGVDRLVGIGLIDDPRYRNDAHILPTLAESGKRGSEVLGPTAEEILSLAADRDD